MKVKKCQLKDILISEKPAKIGPNNAATGICKNSIKEPVFISKLGISGDIQVDKRVHGGLEKAVYQYPFENYETLKKFLPHLADNFNCPAVGENLSSIGLNESDVHIGDVFSAGTAVLQVSQPRMPCWKLNHKIGNAYASSIFISEAITGWYYRVITEGEISLNDELILQERQVNSISVSQIWEIWRDNSKREKIAQLNIPGLSEQWYSIG